MIESPVLQAFLTSLGVGLLMGLERQRHATALAGLRTFPLVAVLGTVCALLAAQAGTSWMLPSGLLALALMMIAAYRDEPQKGDPGTTTTVAVLLCFALGAASWYGYFHLVVGIAIVATSLLHFRDELHGFAARLARDDIVAVLRFVMVSALVLPLLPDRGFGPFLALNPYRLWLMVVLISGLSLGGYLVLRLVGPGRGLPLVGVMGGLASSTATTLSFARQARVDPGLSPAACSVILLANLTVLIRLAILAAVIAPQILPGLLPVLLGGLITGGAFAWSGLRRRQDATAPPLELSNPGDLRAAIAFATLFAIVLVAAAALAERAGNFGIYAVAAVSGLTDVDAISLSAFERLQALQLDLDAAVTAILIAYLANLLFKGASVAFVAGARLARPVCAGFAAAAAGMVVARLIGVVLTIGGTSAH